MRSFCVACLLTAGGAKAHNKNGGREIFNDLAC